MSLSLFYSLYVYLSLINFSINNWIGIITKSPTMFLTPLVCLFQVVSSFSNSFIIEVRIILFIIIQYIAFFNLGALVTSICYSVCKSNIVFSGYYYCYYYLAYILFC